ncbi:SCO3242 family prenyltransferase [Streptomyces sp. NPDC058579]|uniref:SCO3242 family prenyltransferase n=1 Tax=Streptomyces sp. NPDC058579 TaxID=3346548 RepID=UPI00365A4AD4
MSRARGRVTAWAELLRVSALATVPGDALAGAAAAGLRPNRSTLLAIGSSLCLYEAGMALNDWADRVEDAVDRPGRPIPSGRVTPRAALVASATLTAAGLALAARAGRPTLATATALAATVWSYDLHLKHTPAAPATMATARALNLLLGTVATSSGCAWAGGVRRPGGRGVGAAVRAAAAVGAHTYAVTAVSRHETQGGSTRTPLLALATTLTLTALMARPSPQPTPSAAQPTTGADRFTSGPTAGTVAQPTVGLKARAVTHPTPGPTTPAAAQPTAGADRLTVGADRFTPGADRFTPGAVARPAGSPAARAASAARPRPAGTAASRVSAAVGPLITAALAASYARTPATPLLHAALNPSPPLTQRSVGAGIRALIPLQATLAARSGAPGTALLVLGLAPLARALARKVSPT